MHLINIFISILLNLLSATALPPTPSPPQPNHPPPIQRHISRALPLLLNTTTPLSLPTANAIQLNCYAPDPHQPLIRPSDCHTLLYTLLTSPTTMLLHRWNRSSNLPIERTFQTCSIIFALASATSDDIFQPVLVAHAAALLVQSCVTTRYGYQGGNARIGTIGGFVVFVSAVGAGDGVSVMEG